MSNERDGKKPATEIDSESYAAESLSNRRRVLRAGVKVVPVVLGTLSARTALACHCTIPSAWGSIATGLGGPQDMSKVNLTGSLVRFGSNDSVNAADNIKSFSNNFRSIPNWQFAGAFVVPNTSSAPWNLWKQLISKVSSFPTGCDTRVKQANYLRGLWSGATPLSAGGTNGLLAKLGISGITWSETADAILNGNSYKSSILVGLLALRLGSTFASVGCLKQSDLVAMANGTFPVPQGFSTFGPAEIKDYLHYNWIARWDTQ